MGRDALRAVTSADVAALLPGGGGAGTRVFTAVCVAPGGDRFYLGDDDGDIIACRVVRGADADGVMTASVRVAMMMPCTGPMCCLGRSMRVITSLDTSMKVTHTPCAKRKIICRPRRTAGCVPVPLVSRRWR